jgi:hypothetical protein
MSPNLPWHSSQESSIRDEAKQVASEKFTVDTAPTYSLAELIDLAESHNPETHVAWERARSLVDAFGVARSELYPTLVAVALSQTSRQQAFLNRQVVQSSDLAFDLNYTIFDFGGRAGRIDQAKARLLASDFNFNDAHRRAIYRIETAYYQLFNAIGQEEAARANLENADAVQQAAESSLKNGLATLPDVLEGRSAVAEAAYTVQAAIGTQATNPVVIRLDRGIVRLRGRIQKSPCGLPLAEGSFQIGVCGPDAIFNLISRDHRLCPRCLHVVLGLRQRMLSGASVEYRPAQTESDLPIETCGVPPGQCLLCCIERLRVGISMHPKSREVCRFRFFDPCIRGAVMEMFPAQLQDSREPHLDVTEAQRTLAQARSTDVLARTQVLGALADLSFQTADSIQPASGWRQP